MPKSIKGTEPVIDPLRDVPRLAGQSEFEGPASFTDPTPPRASVKREVIKQRPGSGPHDAFPFKTETLTVPVCPGGHTVEPSMRFCPECGAELVAAGPLTCRNGHEVTATSKFCATCGVPLAEEAIFSGSADHRPRPETELSDAEKAERLRMHDMALRLGREVPAVAYAPGRAPAGTPATVVHFLVDGITAFGNVWMRGQEIEVWPGHPRWREAQGWINLDVAGQYSRYGRQVFGYGPWPGIRTYTAGAGKFQHLKSLDSDEAEVPQPTAEDLARADEAEARRGRRVPMPIM